MTEGKGFPLISGTALAWHSEGARSNPQQKGLRGTGTGKQKVGGLGSSFECPYEFIRPRPKGLADPCEFKLHRIVSLCRVPRTPMVT